MPAKKRARSVKKHQDITVRFDDLWAVGKGTSKDGKHYEVWLTGGDKTVTLRFPKNAKGFFDDELPGKRAKAKKR